jgi:hypothetical protein
MKESHTKEQEWRKKRTPAKIAYWNSMKGRNKKHGMVGTRFYKAYENIKTRCNSKKHKNYRNYGGRGILCLWDDFESFKRDMYESYLVHVKNNGEHDTTIDRIDNNGNYFKENCKWSTRSEQQLNRRDTVMVPLLEVENALGISDSTLRRWIKELGLKDALNRAVLSQEQKIRQELLDEIINSPFSVADLCENSQEFIDYVLSLINKQS